MQEHYDAVVVGSGFGGGVSACRLAEAGWSVAVLERGRRFDRHDFPDRAQQVPWLLWHPQVNPNGMFDLRLFKDIAVLMGAGVGGGSLIYANVLLSAPPDAFGKSWPAGTDRDALEPSYQHVEEALEPRPVPEPTPPKVSAFARAGEEFGSSADLLPIAVHYGDDRANPFGGAAQRGCTNLGRCITGCPRHAKNSIDLTYLARAERHGAVVKSLSEALELVPPDSPNGHWSVGFRDLAHRTSGTVRARKVILAGGALGTTRLLLRNRRRLRRLSSALGTRFSSNGNALGAVFDPTAAGTHPVRAQEGPTITSRMDLWTDRGFLIEDLGVPPFAMGLLDVIRGVDLLRRPERWLARVKRLLAGAGLSDRSVSPLEVRLARPDALKGGQATDNALFMLFIGRDNAGGQMRLSPVLRRFELTFPRRANAPLFERMEATLQSVGNAVGGGPVFSSDNGPLGLFLTAHPLGGCPMAVDRSQGVVDPYGRVFGYEESLSVLDGSIIPAPLGANPSKTIAALAERGVRAMIGSGGSG